jgi:hypothetical protein
MCPHLSQVAHVEQRSADDSAGLLAVFQALRTGQANLSHPALGQDFTPSPTARRVQAQLSVRAQSTRRGARSPALTSLRRLLPQGLRAFAGQSFDRFEVDDLDDAMGIADCTSRLYLTGPVIVGNSIRLVSAVESGDALGS